MSAARAPATLVAVSDLEKLRDQVLDSRSVIEPLDIIDGYLDAARLGLAAKSKPKSHSITAATRVGDIVTVKNTNHAMRVLKTGVRDRATTGESYAYAMLGDPGEKTGWEYPSTHYVRASPEQAAAFRQAEQSLAAQDNEEW